MIKHWQPPLLFLLALLTACTSGPTFNTRGIEPSLTAQAAVAAPQTSMGQRVLWGGVILNTTNHKDSTFIEVLTYPLNHYHKPKTSHEPQGRMIIEQIGFLEPATYAEGRLISVSGVLDRVQQGQVGESSYHYPVVSALQIHLWSKESENDRSNVHFGIGIGIGL